MKYIGIDCHKEFCVASVLNDAGQEVGCHKFKTRKDAILDFLKGFDEDKANVKMVIESTVRWRMVYDIITEAGYSIILAHPKGVKMIADAKVKTDKVDARTLAELLRVGYIPEAHVASKNAQEWRQIVRHRDFLVKEATGFKNRIHADIREAGIDRPKDVGAPFSKKGKAWMRSLDMVLVSDLLDCLEALTERIKKVDHVIEKECDRSREAIRLREVPGFGSYTALTLVAEIDDIERFESAAALCNYFGIVPSVSQSGRHCSHGRITKQGSPMVRHLLEECVMVHVNCCPDSKISRFYERKAKEIGRPKAIVAAARKLLVAVFFMLKRNEPFRGPRSDLDGMSGAL